MAMKFTVVFAFLVSVNALTSLKVVYEWKQLSFEWPNQVYENEVIARGVYIPENSIPIGLGIWKNKLFVTVPRWKAGVPASLTYIDLNTTRERSPKLIPYPNWKSHDLQKYSSDTIVSPFRLHVDQCDRLWIMETGIDDILGNTTVYGPASIIIIDLNTDKIVHRYNLKSSDQESGSFFANVVIDVDKQNCNDAYAYLTDLGGYGLVIYSLSQNDSWRFTHHFFNFEPLLGNLFIGGVNFQWEDGIFGAALGPKRQDGYRTLYFHPFISYNEFSVNTRTLKNKSLAENNDYYLWKHEGFKGENAASLVSVFDEISNTLITSLPKQDGIGCWNPKYLLNPNTFNLIASDYKTLVFPSDLKIDDYRNLWVISDKLPVFQYSILNPNEVNFRILISKVDDLISGTNCVDYKKLF